MKKLLSGILAGALMFTLCLSAAAEDVQDTAAEGGQDAAAADAVLFTDVLPGSWYYEEVGEMVAAGYLNGYEDGSFQPERTVTVAEAVTMTARMLGADTGEAEGFWGGVQMDNAYRSGWISEDDVPRAEPNTPVTRELACKIIAAALGLGYPAGTTLPFSDADSITEGCRSSVLALYANGLIGGYEDNTIRPQATLTRAQAAALLYRSVNGGSEPEDTDEPDEPEYITASGYGAAEIIDYFCSVGLSAEYNESPNAVLKWTGPVKYFISGEATQADRDKVASLAAALNAVAGFPGISEAASPDEANLSISFVDLEGMTEAAGGAYNGYVTVWWDSGVISRGEIYYRTDLEQSHRDAVIVEELCQSLGLLQDTYDHPESIFYQYHTEIDWPSPLDWAIIELLYSPELRPGMDEESVRSAAAGLVR